MTIPEAAQLVIQAGALSKGGEVFVLDMGQPVKILDLAKKMVRLMGYSEDPTSERFMDIQFTGLRLAKNCSKNCWSTTMPWARCIPVLCAPKRIIWNYRLKTLVANLSSAIEARDAATVRQLLLDAPTGFKPMSENVDFISTIAQQSKELSATQLH